MKKQLLKKLTFAFALFAFASLSAQTFTFDSDLEGFEVDFGEPTTGTIAWDSDGGVGTLKLTRGNNNANFGPTLPNQGAGVDADDKDFIKIIIKNLTASTNIRVGGAGGDATSGNTNFNVLTAENSNYETHYLDMRTVPFWNGLLTNLWFGVTGNIGTDSDGAYVDSIEIIDLSEVPPGVLPEFSEYIANPNFEDPTGLGHMSGNGGGNFTRALITTDSQDGANNLEMTFSGTPGANGIFTFSNFAQTHTPALNAATTQFVSTMWVKSAKDINVVVRLKINDDGAPGIGGNEELIDDTQAVIGNSTWQQLTFTNTPTMDVEQLNFWFGVESNGDAGDPVNGDVVYFDNMTGSIVSVPLSVEKNTLEGVSVYPNPVRETLSINSPDGSDIILYNVLGATVKTFKKANALQDVSVSNLESGLYFVRVINEGKVFQTKIIKN